MGRLVRACIKGSIAVVASALIGGCGGGGGNSSAGGGSSPAPEIAITAQPADVHATDGAAATFTVGVSGSASFAWQRQSGSTWSDIAGATGPSLTLAPVRSADSGARFRAVVTSQASAANRLTSSAATLTVDPAVVPAAIAIQPADKTVVESQSTSFSVTATGTALQYQWQRSADGVAWADVAGAAAATFTLAASLGDDGAYFRVVVANSLGRAESAAVRLRVTRAPSMPVFTLSPLDATGYEGMGVVLNVVATGSPAPAIAWQSSPDGIAWATIPSATGGTLLVSLTSANHLRRYRAVATNDSGSVTSASALMIVMPVPVAPSITVQPAGAALQTNGFATFSVTASGVPSVQYQWQVSTDLGASFTNINGATAASYLGAHVLADDRKRFRVVVSNGAGSVTSQAAELRVMNAPVVRMPLDPEYWRPGISGAYFLAQAAGSELSYQWYLSGNGGVTKTAVPGETQAAYVMPAVVSMPANSSGAIDTVCVTVTNPVGSAERCTPLHALRWNTVQAQPTSVTLQAVRWRDASTAIAVGDSATIVRSTDGGASWAVVDEGVGDLSVLRALVLDGSLALAVGDQGRIARSIDGGAHWTQFLLDDHPYLTGLALNASGSAFAVGRIQSSGRIRRSTDAGITWQAPVFDPATAPLDAIAFNTVGIGLAVGAGGTVARSADDGQTWTTTTIGSARLYAVAFASSQVVLAAGSSGALWRSSDAGASWSAVTSGTSARITSLRFADALAGVALTDDGRALHTSDGGLTWSAPVAVVAGLPLMAIDFAPGNLALSVGAGGTILRSTDRAATWSPATTGARDHLIDVAFATSTTGVAVGNQGVVLRSVDGGTSWSRTTVPGTAAFQRVAFADATTGIALGATGFQGDIFRTTDAGLNWSPVVLGAPSLYWDIAFANATLGLIASDNGVLRTTDGGLTWSATTGFAGTVLSVAFADAQTALAVSLWGAVLRSTDGGSTWSTVTSQSNALRSVTFSSATNAVAVGDAGTILHSADAGQTWQAVPNLLSFVGFKDVRFFDALHGVAIGYYGTVMRTADGGATWRDEDVQRTPDLNGLARVNAASMVAVGLYGTIVRTDSLD